MRRIVMDAESDGLLAASTQLHCLVLRDLDSDRVVSCTNSASGYTPLEEGLALLSAAETIYGHNIIHFDLPLIEKLYPDFKYVGKVRDTLITAQMRWAHITDSDFARYQKGTLPAHLIGLHTLEAWGFRLGILKVGTGIEDWSKWTPLMQERCVSDTAITKTLAQRIQAAGVTSQSLDTEHRLAFYLREQEKNGWPFDLEGAQALQAKLAARRQAVEIKLADLFLPWQKSMGMFTPKVNNKARGYVKGVPMERFKQVSIFTKNGISRDKVAELLQTQFNWKPSVFTDGGKPKVDDDTLEGLTFPGVAELKEFFLLLKRLGQIAEGKEAWIGHATLNAETGLYHIHGRVKQNHAITHRAAHSSPNVAQTPAVYSPYGKECRTLWHAPKGWVEVGADASGLELRCLAHHMAKYDGGAYGKLVLADKPNDVHTANSVLLSGNYVLAVKPKLIAVTLKVSRDDAKTFIYAMIYGAGDEKLGKILAPGKTPKEHISIGQQARARFLKQLPALKYLLEAIQLDVKKKGYLLLLDGRRAYIRSEHAALNTLLQGDGAIICKRWIITANDRLIERFGSQGWKGQWAAMGWIHDETQTATREQHGQEVGLIWKGSIQKMTEHFNFRVPLDGDFKIGHNWADCH